jgi:hypothetical protein
MRSKQEIRGIVGGFAQSGMTRREYCARQNIGIATLDDWRRIEKKGRQTSRPPLSSKNDRWHSIGRRLECTDDVVLILNQNEAPGFDLSWSLLLSKGSFLRNVVR